MRPSQLEQTIREITQDLQELSVTPHVRELRARAVTYARVVGSWTTYAPTAPQMQAMVECVTELQEKALEAKHESNRDVSRVTRRQSTEPQARRGAPPPIPSGLEWSASVPATNARSPGASKPAPAPPTSRNDAPTLPPPDFGAGASTIPPVSAPRPIDHPTPVPALLRSRRSR